LGQRPQNQGQDCECIWTVEDGTKVSPKIVEFSEYLSNRSYNQGNGPCEVRQIINSGYPYPINQNFFVRRLAGSNIVTVICKFSFPTLTGRKELVETVFIEVQ
ncbi:MAG TPA: hypothetical protein VEP90_25445, partial [Methylomirabilota bacterium]|nr:hypothetical protein [Methylomirabilota bacterium]